MYINLVHLLLENSRRFIEDIIVCNCISGVSLYGNSENFNLTNPFQFRADITMTRIEALKAKAQKQGKPGNLAIFNQQNITYFTNFSGAVALLIQENGDNILYVSGVNLEQAKVEAKNVTVQQLKRGESVIEKIAKQTQTNKLCVDLLSIESYQALARASGGEEKIEAANHLIRDMRRVKDQEEITLIKEACRLADIGLKAAGQAVQPGVKEKDVAAEAEYAMRKAGSDGVAFDTIVASGHCCAYPHGTFLDRTIAEGDLVVVDLGATWRFYRSDITRTFVAGKPTEKQSKMFEAVKSAHRAALDAIAPNVLAKEVDSSARGVIGEAGFSDYFVHNLGHGVGLEVHEAPILSPDSKDILEAGNVVTNEPGIYLPLYGGVRLEDTILVTEKGAEKLTLSPYRL